MTRRTESLISSTRILYKYPASAVSVFQLLWLIFALHFRPTFGFFCVVFSPFSSSLSTSHWHRATPTTTLGDLSVPRSRQKSKKVTSSTVVVSMMKGSVFCAVTLDGFIAETNGDVSFLNEFGSGDDNDDDDDTANNKPADDDPYSFENFLASVDVIIMGRKSFEKVLSFGRNMWAYGNTRIVVWTTQEDYAIPEFLQESVSYSNLSPTALWDDLQNQGYQHAYIDGGATIGAFDELIEDWILTRVPLILGQGISLFAPNSMHRFQLTHVHTQSMSSGLVTSHYRSQSKREDAKPED